MIFPDLVGSSPTIPVLQHIVQTVHLPYKDQLDYIFSSQKSGSPVQEVRCLCGLLVREVFF